MKTTTGGNEALSVWEEHGRPIDLLLTDMIMPDGMTGRDLAKQLLTRNPDLKVIYTSGYSAESEGPPSELRQAPAFLQKPYHPQKLARAVIGSNNVDNCSRVPTDIRAAGLTVPATTTPSVPSCAVSWTVW